jgi:hypothetical protein
MTEEEFDCLHDRVKAMSKEKRLELDPIAAALNDYQKANIGDRGWRIVPNRAAALAAVDAMNAWEKTSSEMD